MLGDRNDERRSLNDINGTARLIPVVVTEMKAQVAELLVQLLALWAFVPVLLSDDKAHSCATIRRKGIA